MRKILVLALPLGLAAAPALAQDSTGTVTIGGSVAGRCLFTTPNEAIVIGEMALGGADANAGKLDTAKVNGKSKNLAGWCNNAAAGMTVEAFPLINTAAAATGFTSRVNYTATATANNVSATDTSLEAGKGSTASVGMFTGNVTVALSNASAGNALLVAGKYDGSVEVTLTPVFTPPSPE